MWISNQIGNTGMLTGFIQDDNVTTRPFNPNPDFYKPATVTGAPAASVDLAVTDPDFTFPQTWRSNVGVDQKLPWGMIGTAEFIYNRDVNGIYYINANLPAAQSAFVGADNSSAVGGNVLRDGHRGTVRHPSQQRGRQSDYQRDRAEEPERRPFVEYRVQRREDSSSPASPSRARTATACPETPSTPARSRPGRSPAMR